MFSAGDRDNKMYIILKGKIVISLVKRPKKKDKLKGKGLDENYDSTVLSMY